MGWLWHGLAALGIVLAMMVHPLSAVVSFAAVGYFFEKTQHRYIWFIDRGGKLQRKKTGWTGWITKHRLLEGAGWPVGALIGSIVWMVTK